MLMIAGVYRMLIIALLVTTALGCERKVAGGSVDGARIFKEVCARCHGKSGEPNSSMVARYGVKSLRSARVQGSLTDDDIRKQILNGSKNKQMPSFDGAMSDEQIAAVIAHIRTFKDPPADATPPPAAGVPAAAKPAPAKPAPAKPEPAKPEPAKPDDGAKAPGSKSDDGAKPTN